MVLRGNTGKHEENTMSIAQTILIPLADIVRADNVRLTFQDSARTSEWLEILQLSEDIESAGYGVDDTHRVAFNGLRTNLVVQLQDDGKYLTLQGHRRGLSLEAFAKRNPGLFKSRFPDGIPCNVVPDGIDPTPYLIDHGNQLPLRDPYELQLCADRLYAQGHTEKSVANEMHSLFTRVIGGLKGKRRDKVKELDTVIAKAKADKDFTTLPKAEADKATEIAAHHRGTCQHLKNVWRSPDCVRHAMVFKATGEVPQGAETPLPSLTVAQVTELVKALDVDVRDVSGEYSKALPGPAFNTAWQKIVAAAVKKASEPTTVATKSVSSKDIKSTGEALSSQGLKRLCDKLSDSTDRTDITDIDKDLFALELVKKHDNGLYKKVIKRGDEILKQKQKAGKAEAEAKLEAEADTNENTTVSAS